MNLVEQGGEKWEAGLLELMVVGLVLKEAEWVDMRALQIKTLLKGSSSRTIS